MSNQKRFYFEISLCGEGETPEEAWEKACEAFELDPGCTPEVSCTEEVEDDD